MKYGVQFYLHVNARAQLCKTIHCLGLGLSAISSAPVGLRSSQLSPTIEEAEGGRGCSASVFGFSRMATLVAS